MPTTATNPQGLTPFATSPDEGQAPRCVKCGEVKPLEEFEPRKERQSGYRHDCRPCRRRLKGQKTGGQVRRIAERRRERKAEGRTHREQLAEMTVQDLTWVLGRIPAGDEYDEWRQLVNRAVSKIRKSGRRTTSAATEAVEKALTHPFNQAGATAEDLASDTGIPEPVVQQILDSLISNDTVLRCTKEVPPEANFDEPIWLYKLTGAKPSSPLVLP